MLKVKLAAGIWERNATSPSKKSSKFSAKKEESKSSKTSKNLLVDRTVQLEDLIPAAVVVSADKPIKDFFGRIIVKKNEDQTNQSSHNSTDLQNRPSIVKKFSKSVVSFKFNEGYSNAVRKPLFLSDIFSA